VGSESTPSAERRPGAVAGLARRCAQEMARFRRRQAHDPSPCYELFRRALVRRDEAAWAALYGQYHRLVRRWTGSAAGDADLLPNQAFERFWRAIPPDRFSEFPTLNKLLAYLKRCAQSVAIDAARKEERRQVREAALARRQELAAARSQASPLEGLLDRAAGEQVYEHVLGCLSGPQERLVFRASFEWNLKPRTIAERWPDLVGGAGQVYRIKERILRRLRRDAELRALLARRDGDGGET
jgi:DNA-directed RNA polymerase specialized sigma24 family protein